MSFTDGNAENMHLMAPTTDIISCLDSVKFCMCAVKISWRNNGGHGQCSMFSPCFLLGFFVCGFFGWLVGFLVVFFLTEAPMFPVPCYAKELNFKIHSCSILMKRTVLETDHTEYVYWCLSKTIESSVTMGEVYFTEF